MGPSGPTIIKTIDMSTYITLEEAKAHLRVDFIDDDDYIQALIDMTEAAVEMEIGEFLSGITWTLLTGSTTTGYTTTTGIQATNTSGAFPLRLKQAMLLMIGHFYSNRESVIIGVSSAKIPMGFDWLLNPYKNWTIK